MDQAVIALVGLTLMVMIHLDRSRGKAMRDGFEALASAMNQLRVDLTGAVNQLRAETTGAVAELRAQTTEANDKLRGDLTGAVAELRAETTEANDKLRAEMQQGFAANATALLELARNVGRVEGRTETQLISQ